MQKVGDVVDILKVGSESQGRIGEIIYILKLSGLSIFLRNKQLADFAISFKAFFV